MSTKKQLRGFRKKGSAVLQSFIGMKD